jgi:hypothetical protein
MTMDQDEKGEDEELDHDDVQEAFAALGHAHSGESWGMLS